MAEDFVDDAGGEACGYEVAHYAGGFPFVFRLADAFAFEVLAGKGFFIGIGVAGFDSGGDNLRGHAFLGEGLADAALAESLICWRRRVYISA